MGRRSCPDYPVVWAQLKLCVMCYFNKSPTAPFNISQLTQFRFKRHPDKPCNGNGKNSSKERVVQILFITEPHPNNGYLAHWFFFCASQPVLINTPCCGLQSMQTHAAHSWWEVCCAQHTLGCTHIHDGKNHPVMTVIIVFCAFKETLATE